MRNCKEDILLRMGDVMTTEKRFAITEVEINDYPVECADAKRVITDNDVILTNDQMVEIANDLHERNTRQAETIKRQQEQIDNFINVKAKLDGKISEYATKSEEYEEYACHCGAKHNAIKKEALIELKEELFSC